MTREPTQNRTATLHEELRTLGVHVFAPENRNDPVLGPVEVGTPFLARRNGKSSTRKFSRTTLSDGGLR